MSIQVADIDLSTAAAGATGTVTWAGQVMPQATTPWQATAGEIRPLAHLRLWNESGCGLKIQTNTGRQDVVPAGAWPVYELIPGETNLTYTVSYVLPGAPVAQLFAILYQPGEAVPPTPVLGNSPIGIGGTVQTSTVNQLINDNNPPATEIIEATPSDQSASSWKLFNDASGYVQVLSANVLRIILKVVRGDASTTKASIQLGDSGDTTITTLYGTVGAGSNVPASVVTGTLPASQLGAGYPSADLGAGTVPSGVVVPGGQVSGAVAEATNADFLAPPGQVPGMGTQSDQDATPPDGNVSDIIELVPQQRASTLTTTLLTLKTAAGTKVNGPILRTNSPTFAVQGQFQDYTSQNNYPLFAAFTGTGAGTYTHHLTAGKTPMTVQLIANEANSTQTMGVDSLGATSVHCNMPNAWPFYGMVALG